MNDFLETYDNETLLEWASEHNASNLAAVRQARAELHAEMAEDFEQEEIWES
jgi:hypothetical protein